ncbi:bifunctional diaminohydroxyphosphoribosylaminopyrimidine deaminase/5-amino-6-(5-phosphoribosylamino)uracil reductase RibD [Diaphorobacter sp. HDW4B]|uniref:bifunctional diaminohydroxyphosphoribosylaminopyrimidine deaminase/5-amino-6-(5-phosphoribosylamino)uracil reductase RibD n=1 Tax=Diaphorobacter sp. HDW4B TaxID=2714925 RepID=UPI001F0EA8D5|nr:bifunctional diaminohydroxyphosphoribosylaminopyrimidine deaminase/5-amino-6-(5-phosphoribosylamino)uracil reductase RibD [Diaphorobacter sp. HDW4B]
MTTDTAAPSSAPSDPMQRAIALARNALFISNPNPRVGCVIMSADGTTELGSGFTQQAGGPHAEVMALRDAAARGSDVRGATAYVTLEPCSHHGRTGPCCDALIAAGIGKVVGAITDPNPRVAGQGFDRLRAAGIEVSMDDAAGQQSRDLNIGFFSRMVRKQPWVRLKAGMSLDGATALRNGQSQWITSEAARADGHRWRAQACAILTGIGTVLGDDPMLNVRHIDTPRQPRVVIVDSQLRTPPTAQLFDIPREVLIYCATVDAARRSALEARGAKVIHLPAANGQVDLQAMIQDLGQREMNELHVEAGGTLNGALMQAGLIDECLLYIAPRILGDAQTAFSGMALTQLADTPQMAFKEVTPIGSNLRIRAVVADHERF